MHKSVSFVVAALAIGAAACGSSTGSAGARASTPASATASSPAASPSALPSVVVGTANFTENQILGYIYADALKAKGVQASVKPNIGSREVYFNQLKSGALTVFPEYNGNLLTYLNPKATASSTTAVDKALASALPANLEALAASSAQDTDSVTVTQAFAKAHHLTSIADLRTLAPQMVIGGPPEFRTRHQGLPGLARVYGLHFKAFKPLDTAGPLTVAALKNGTVQAADIFTTDPSLVKDHFVALADPKHNFSAQNVIPIISRSVANPTVVKTLDAVSAKLTTSILSQLVAAVANQHVDATVVAAQFDKQVGLG